MSNPGISEITRQTCETYRRAIAAGEAQASVIGYLAEQYGVHRPAIWKRLRAGGLIPDYGHNDGKPIGRTAAGVIERRLEGPLPEPVKRDPCPRCGVRADIGCKHRGAPVGMMFGMVA